MMIFGGQREYLQQLAYIGQISSIFLGPLSWVQQQMSLGVDPRELLRHILPRHASVPADLDQLMLWKLIINILSEPPPRKKLKHINTLDQVVSLIKDCKNIMVLTGAGVST